MSNVLVFLQNNGAEIAKVSLCALDAAKQILAAHSKSEIHAVLLGENAASAANEALKLGVAKAFYSEAGQFTKYLAPSYADVVASLAADNDCGIVVAAASSTGRDFMPIVAASLEAGQASDVIAVNSDGSFKRPMYAGNIIADVEVLSDKKVLTVRASSFSAVEAGAAAGEAVEIQSLPEAYSAAEVVSYEIAEQERPDLTAADVVVSGGRALASTENFEKYLYPFADALGAAVGASRAAVDAGYVPNDWQVGQTGKIVAPSLYFAVGLSGAIQHLAGMKDSKCIVAINTDAEAPIFEVADYGLVADLFEVLPELTEKVKS